MPSRTWFAARNFGHDSPLGQAREDLLDQAEARLDLADADPTARIDVALGEHRHVELQRVVGRIAHPCGGAIEGAAGGAAHIAAGAEARASSGLRIPVVTVRS
jgi:hypothetical protein